MENYILSVTKEPICSDIFLQLKLNNIHYFSPITNTSQ